MGSRLSAVVPDPIRRRYALKFAIVLATLGLSIAAIGGAATVTVAHGIEQSVQEEYRFAASQEADRIGKWISTNERFVRAASNSTVLAARNMSSERVRENANEYLSRQTELAQMNRPTDFLLVDADSGAVLAQSVTDIGSEAIDSNFVTDGDAEWFRNLRVEPSARTDSRSVITGPDDTYTSTVFASYGKQEMIAFLSPVVGNTDRLLVWLVERPGPDFLRGQQMEAAGSYTVVVGENRRILFHETISNRLNKTYPDIGVFDGAGRVGGKTVSSSAEMGVKHVVGYAPVEERGWTVLVHAPTDNAYGKVTTVRKWGGIATLLGVALIAVVGAVLGRNTAVAIEKLTEKANRIENGELNVAFETDRIDNIGQLYRQFDSMQESLRRRIEETEQAREELQNVNNQLQVLDRMLRHNLQNDMTVIRLNAESFQREAPPSFAEYAEKIVEVSDKILDKAEKQREVTKTLAIESEMEPLDVEKTLETVQRELSTEFDEAEIRLDANSDPTARAIPQIKLALFELVENAIVHNDSDTPRVEIEARQTNGSVEIRVADNGPCIPEMERRAITDKQIDPLSHASGIGLWLVFWAVSQSGGEIEFDENEPRGSIVSVTLPVDDDKQVGDEQAESEQATGDD